MSIKIITEHVAKDHVLETFQCKLKDNLLGQGNSPSFALHNKASVIRATSYRHCKL